MGSNDPCHRGHEPAKPETIGEIIGDCLSVLYLLVAGCALVASVIASLVSPAHAEWSPADMNRTIDQTNFLVNDNCSGTLIDAKERLILTANHCVKDQYQIVERETVDDDGVINKEKVRRLRDGTVTQMTFDGSENIGRRVYAVRVAAVDKLRDLALLQIKGAKLANATVARLACKAPVRGEKIYIVGNPLGSLYSSVTAGIVSSNQRDYGTVDFGDSDQVHEPVMQVSAGMIGGGSGGAVYDDHGDMVGVPVFGSTKHAIIGFAVPLEEIKVFLKENKADGLFDHCKTDR